MMHEAEGEAMLCGDVTVTCQYRKSRATYVREQVLGAEECGVSKSVLDGMQVMMTKTSVCDRATELGVARGCVSGKITGIDSDDMSCGSG
jgi:hypothetical protein